MIKMADKMPPSVQPQSSAKTHAYLRWTFAASLVVLIGTPLFLEAHRLVRHHEAVTALRGSRCHSGFKKDKGETCGCAFVDSSTRYQKLLAACGVPEPRDIYQLDARGSQLEDSQLWHLHRLTGLCRVTLDGRPITNQGLAQLAGLTDLTALSLRRTRITDDGLQYLLRIPHLTYLDLSRTAVTDNGLKNLQESNQLATLILSHTTVSDAGLSRLHRLHRLKNLVIIETRVTDEGIDELTCALPKCKVTYSVRLSDEVYVDRVKGPLGTH